MRFLKFISLFTLIIGWSFVATACFATGPSGEKQTLEANAEAFAMLKQPGHHAIIRHTLAPEIRDPLAAITLGCDDERNLSREGQRQAVNLGQAFQQLGFEGNPILTSHICRTRDTGRLMALGPVKDETSLKPIIDASQAETQDQTQALIERLQAYDPAQTAILITHGYNIAALVGQAPASGHGFVIHVDNSGAKIVAEISSYWAD